MLFNHINIYSNNLLALNHLIPGLLLTALFSWKLVSVSILEPSHITGFSKVLHYIQVVLKLQENVKYNVCQVRIYSECQYVHVYNVHQKFNFPYTGIYFSYKFWL